MSRLMSVTAVRWSTVRSYSKASSNSCCQCESGPKAWPGNGLAGGVELEKLLGHVPHGFFARGFSRAPTRRRYRGESRGGTRGARVFLDEIEPLDGGTNNLSLARIAQLEEFLHRVADADFLESGEAADAVIDVDDEVADLQVAQVGEEGFGGRRPSLWRAALFLEDVGFRIDLESSIGQPKAARKVANRDEYGGVLSVLCAIDGNREDFVLLEQPRSCARRGPSRRRRTTWFRLHRAAQARISEPPSRRRGRGVPPFRLTSDSRCRPSPKRLCEGCGVLEAADTPASQSRKRSDGAGSLARRHRSKLSLELLDQLSRPALQPRRARRR